jgi:two-component system nitrate/nitrite sensor histidine kinase NarX
VERWEEMSGIAAKLSIEPGLTLRPAHELQLVRIIQESLTNVRKHARATEARVEVRHEDGSLLVTIADNGMGFNAAARARGEFPQFGLSTMKERAESIGGALTISSTAAAGMAGGATTGGGTRVSFTMPFAGTAE